ncbi:MAG: MATE family efflux transporter [Syntrophaceae bacterium]
MEHDTNTGLTTAPIPVLIAKLAVPASVGFFFNTMFNVVDTFFGGMISTQAQAALSLSFPVFFIIIALGSGLSYGATAVIANALGAGRDQEARVLSSQTISLACLSATVLTAIGMLAARPLFIFLGAGAAYLGDCLAYMYTIFAGTLFFLGAYAFNAILNALGDTRSFRNFLIFGFLTNVILDPWFIFGGLGVPAMGIAGLALSTILIELMGTLYLAGKVGRTGMLGAPAWKDFRPRLEPMGVIIRQGLPASLNMLTVGLGIFVIIAFISPFGKAAVAAYGIAVRIEQIVLLPAIGLSVATLTLVAHSNGARLFGRIRQTLRAVLVSGGICMALGGLVILLLAETCMRIFSADAEVIRIGATYLRIDALALYAYVILSVHVATLQGIKKPGFAVLIGLLRQIIAPALLFALLIKVWHYGLLGVWWGICIITWTAAVITALYAQRLLKKTATSS